MVGGYARSLACLRVSVCLCHTAWLQLAQLPACIDHPSSSLLPPPTTKLAQPTELCDAPVVAAVVEHESAVRANVRGDVSLQALKRICTGIARTRGLRCGRRERERSEAARG